MSEKQYILYMNQYINPVFSPGYFYDDSGDYTTTFLFLGSCSLLAAFIFLAVTVFECRHPGVDTQASNGKPRHLDDLPFWFDLNNVAFTKQ